QKVLMGASHKLLFEDRVVAVTDEAGTDGLGIFDVGEGADLNMEELVCGRSCGHERGVLFLLQRVYERFRIFLLAYSSHLNKIAGRGQGGHRVGRIGGGSLSLA